MSLNVFKTQLLRYMQTEPETSDDFAEFLTAQYDAAVKRGYDTLNLVPIQTGNTNTMEAVLKALFKKNNTIKNILYIFFSKIISSSNIINF